MYYEKIMGCFIWDEEKDILKDIMKQGNYSPVGVNLVKNNQSQEHQGVGGANRRAIVTFSNYILSRPKGLA